MAAVNQLDDATRIQKLLDELKPANKSSQGQAKSVEMDLAARGLLMEYANELTCAILEEAACVAGHRNSTEIDAADVNFVLLKKLGLEVPGYSKGKTLLHKQAYKANWPGITVATTVHDTVAKVESEQAAQVQAKRETSSNKKRKIEEATPAMKETTSAPKVEAIEAVSKEIAPEN